MTAPPRRIVLARRPEGPVRSEDVRIEVAPEEPLPDGCARLQVEWLSIDPAIRGWMDDKPSYLPPIELGASIRSGVLGTVVESRCAEARVGERVVALGAWAERCVVRSGSIVRRVPPQEELPASYALGVLGGAGLTAWFGLHRVGEPRPGDTVVVSAAAGGVGSIVAQLAVEAGCRVVGIVGTDAKAEWLRERGVHATIQRRREPLSDALTTACPGGIDVYFDSVGGPQLEAVLKRINRGARIVLCGAIASANDPEQRGPRNYLRLLACSARMQGFTTFDYADEWDAGRAELAARVRAGTLQVRETVLDGLEAAPDALRMLFEGGNTGKLLVRLPAAVSAGSAGTR